jgi:hypothetical protein
MSDTHEQNGAEEVIALFERLAEAARRGRFIAYAISAQTEDENGETVTTISDFVILPGDTGCKKSFVAGFERVSAIAREYLVDEAEAPVETDE